MVLARVTAEAALGVAGPRWNEIRIARLHSLGYIGVAIMSSAEVKSCEECGASIYPEHIESHKAGSWNGKLVCVHCLAEHREGQVTIDPGDFGTGLQAAPAPPAVAPRDRDDEDLLVFDDDDRPADQPIALGDLQHTARTPIMTFGSKNSGADDDEKNFKRPLQHDGRGATRCRILHAKLNDGAMKFLQDQINEWIDNHPDIEIKSASTQVGVVEGKSQEPHLIITLFY